MKVRYKRSFLKDLKRIRDPSLGKRVEDVIVAIERSADISQIKHIQKLSSGKNAYRIRIGDYRVGLKIEDDIIILVRFLHRKDMYRYFP